MRQPIEGKPPYVLTLVMQSQPEKCVKRIIENIKAQSFVEECSWERKRRITEEEVTKAAFANIDIENLLNTIGEQEGKCATDKSKESSDHLMALYNKAIEFYSANEQLEQSMVFLTKLKQLFAEKEASTQQAKNAEGGGSAAAQAETLVTGSVNLSTDDTTS